MSIYGLIGLLVAFAGVAVSLACFTVAHFTAKKKASLSDTLAWSGHIATILTTVALVFCCGLLVYCFMTGDTSIEYVVQNRSTSESDLAWLFKLSGLWGGRAGSLLFWAGLISIFNTVVAIRNMKALEKLDNAALFMSQLVLAAFLGVLLFSESNMPFIAMAAEHFDAAGNLTGVAASYWGMNVLLEHWAMAVHPPTLFIGYAGMTIPFAYAIAALIVGDPSKAWVEKSMRIMLFSWLFLGIGIGLGAIWAYVVLGWGGYWGWDPVENASFLPWLVGVALIHSFTVYRKRGAFKRWAVMCACLAFAFVILGTFITRSGIVESVHAFDGDTVSLALFLTLIIASVLIGIAGLAVRWRNFSADDVDGDDFDSLVSKNAAYYLNNLIMIVGAVLLAYLTISSALPTWLPFGGMSLSAGTYNAIARPLGILYLFILSVCPLLSWGKTDGARFLKRARIPALFALVLFIVLMVYFFTTLLPAYNSTISSGGVLAQGLLDEGPSFYYNGLAVIGFLVASLLFFNALFMLGRNVGRYAKAHDINVFAAFFAALKNRASTYGGFISHLAMSIILVGLIGSSMYVSERTDIVSYIEETDSAANDFHIKDYTLKYKDNNIEVQNEGEQVFYTVRFDVYKNGEYQKTVAPTIQVVQTTMQQRLIAGVSSFPTEDLFVVYRGVNDAGAFTLDVKINRLISFVWVGFGLLMIGALVSTIGRRPSLAKISDSDEDDNVGNVVEAEAEIEVDGAVVAEAEVELEAKAETKAKTKSTSAQSKKKPKSSDDLIQEAKEVLETTEKTAEKAAEKTAPKKPAPKKPAAKKPTEKASAKDKKDTKA